MAAENIVAGDIFILITDFITAVVDRIAGRRQEMKWGCFL